MTDEMSAKLAASLRSTASDLAGVANGLAGLGTDDEIEQHAAILDHIAADASEGASILRTLIVRRERAHTPLPRRVPRDSANVPRVPPGLDGDAS